MIPLSPAQQRLWFLSHVGDGGTAYNLPVTVRISQGLDVDALTAALADVVARHECLRTIYPELDGEARQEILEVGKAEPDLIFEHIHEHEIAERVDAAYRHVFDLSTRPPLRVWLFAVGPDEHVLVLLLHHIACDGESVRALGSDLDLAYTARRRGAAPDWKPLPVQYADYALWHREVLGDAADPSSLAAAQLAYWTGALRGLPVGLDLPVDRPRSAEAAAAGGVEVVRIAAAVQARLQEIARTSNTSMFMVFQAAVAVLLTKLGAGEDIPLGTPVSGRSDESLAELIGFFVNTLVLRTDTSGNPTFLGLLERARRVDLEAFAHQDVPFEQVVEAVNPERSAARHPLFQTVVTRQQGVGKAIRLAGLRVRPFDRALGVSRFDLKFNFDDELRDGVAAGIEVHIGYNADLFDRATVRGFGDRLARVLRAVAGRPDRRIGEIDVLSPEERTAILGARSGPEREPHLPEPQFAHRRFEQQALATPDRPALTAGGLTVSYAALDARAGRLAAELHRRALGPEDLIAIVLPASVDQIAAMLGTLKAGCGYVPVDAAHPIGRIRTILRDSRCRLVVTTDEFAGSLGLAEPEWLDAEAWPEGAALSHGHAVGLHPQSPAYVLYTSGSTGLPKGVVVEHRALAAYLHRPIAAYAGLDGLSHVPTSTAFDLTVTALYGTLLRGGHVRLAPLGEEGSGDHIRPAFMKLTPSHLELLKTLPDFASPSATLVLGGEALHASALQEWRARHPDVTVYNAYGPTETTVSCMDHAIPPGGELALGPVPIGRPLTGVVAHVLDAALRPVPHGITGELYLAGPSLARGYLHRGVLTSERFVAAPYGEPGSRMYRTGDLVRRLADGRFEFVGRVDAQVKIRGHRVELGEIESALREQPGVARAAVVARASRSGDLVVVGYVVPGDDDDGDDGVRPDPAAWRAGLQAVLPAHMVPAEFVVLEDLPLTVNGKLDLRALRDLAPASALPSSSANRAAGTPAEFAMCALFAQVLGINQVGPDESFFDLGGHSLLLVRLIGRIQNTLGIDVKVRDVFVAPTPAALVRRAAAEVGDPMAGVLRLRARGDAPPLVCIHPGAGISWSYAGLLRYIAPNRPVYGLQATGVFGDGEPGVDVDAALDAYLSLLRSVQPNGPYHLLGWSVGGLIAHLLAVRLQSDGANVAGLTMLDSYPRAAGAAFREVGREAVVEEIAACLGQVPAPDGSVPGFDAADLDVLVQASTHVRRVFSAPNLGRFAGDVEFFAATRSAPQADRYTPELWRPYVSGQINVHPVDCRHREMTGPDALAVIGPLIDRPGGQAEGDR